MRLFKRRTPIDDAVRCPECGERVPDDADECAMCGHHLHDSPSQSDDSAGMS
jgi:rRNA maturation endonuclease Nob1